MTRAWMWALGLAAVSLYASEEKESNEIVKIDPELSAIKHKDSLPVENFNDVSDSYLEGYIQALIDANYYEYYIIVTVKNHNVYLSNLPKNDLFANSIVTFVRDLPGIKSVEVVPTIPEETLESRKKMAQEPHVNGVWFPQTTVLFSPLIGDPREPMYAVNYRGGDRVMGRKAIAVSMGDDFPFFRWRDVFSVHGDLQIGIQAGVWAVFNFSDVPDRKKNTCELMNTDYLVGIPLTYAFDKWSFRFRLYHISSHLGDEFLVNNPWFLAERKNPSFEALEWINSYQVSSGLRVYGGPGWIFESDDTFKLKPFYVKYGAEVRLFGHKIKYHGLHGTPFLVIHLENWEQHSWNLDQFYMLGYELSKLQGVGRKVRFYLEYHQGYSYEGQFFNERVTYGQIGLSWGF